MRGSWKTPFGPFLVSVLAALLAGPPQTLPAAAQPSPAAGDAVQPAHEPDGTGVQGDGGDPSLTAIQSPRLESLLGREVRTRDEDPGRIIDILCDPDGRVRAAVVELGGFLGIGTRKIAVAWSALRFDGRQKRPIVILELTRDQLRSAPEYKSSDPVFVGRTAD